MNSIAEVKPDPKGGKLQIPDSKTMEQQKSKYLELLNTYNDIKDATQIVVGALAVKEELPTKTLYNKYNISTAGD